MQDTAETFFQIVLFLAAALIGVVTAMNGRKGNTILGGILTICLLSAAVIWYLAGRREPPPVACPYNGGSNMETFQNLIHAEEKAAMAEDMGILRDIYLPEATVTDVLAGFTVPFAERYEQIFIDADFIEIRHYDYEIVQINDTKAWVTSSDSGVMVFSSSGDRLDYVNKPGANHYIFARDFNGCWKISQFSMQAENVPFP